MSRAFQLIQPPSGASATADVNLDDSGEQRELKVRRLSFGYEVRGEFGTRCGGRVKE